MQRGIPEREKNTAYTPHIQEKDMNMRKIMAGLAVTTLVLGSASLALARGHHGGHYGGMMNGYAGNCGASCYTGGYQNLTPEKRAAVASVKKGRDGMEIKTYDKLRALELLGKHLGMFDAKSGREEADALEKLDRLLEGIGDAAAE